MMLLALGIAATQNTAVFAQPPVWESQTGATLPGQALDNVNDDIVNLTFGSMSFPFAGKTYTGNDILNISSNGFISLAVTTAPAASTDAPVIRTPSCMAPSRVSRRSGPTSIPMALPVAVTFSSTPSTTTTTPPSTASSSPSPAGFSDCANNACSALVQVQLLEDGTIIFGYNGIVQTVSQTSDILIGLSPGNGATDPGNTVFSTDVPFDSAMEPTIYQLFSPPQDFDLDDTNLVFTPNGMGGFNVDDTLPDPPPSSAPPTWESALGATIRGAGVGPG